nr:hypothetical protein [Tanacetum cinerariifolium]
MESTRPKERLQDLLADQGRVTVDFCLTLIVFSWRCRLGGLYEIEVVDVDFVQLMMLFYFCSFTYDVVTYGSNSVELTRSTREANIYLLMMKMWDEDYDRINKEMYNDVNVELKDVEPRHTTDLTKEHSGLVDVVEKLKQQYKPQKSAKDIRKVKMEHATKQQETKYTIISFDTAKLQEFD